MIITQETIITFFVPEECNRAFKFEAEHPDWLKDMTSWCIMFRKKENVSAKWEDDL